jgi:hypothetical protein
VDDVHKLLADYGDKVEWVSIYLKEAHAQDVWPLGQHFCVDDHKSVEDRIAAAKKYTDKFKFQIPMVVDGMGNEFLFTYLAHPERFYAFHDLKLQFKAQPVDANYPLIQLRDWLEKHFAAKSS